MVNSVNGTWQVFRIDRQPTAPLKIPLAISPAPSCQRWVPSAGEEHEKSMTKFGDISDQYDKLSRDINLLVPPLGGMQWSRHKNENSLMTWMT